MLEKPKSQILTPIILLIVSMLILIAGTSAFYLGMTFANLPSDSETLAESTAYKLAQWVAQQSEEDEPPALLASWAKSWAVQNGMDSVSEEQAGQTSQQTVWLLSIAIAITCFVGLIGNFLKANWTRIALIGSLGGFVLFLFIFPTIEGDLLMPLTLAGTSALVLSIIFAHGKISRAATFIITIVIFLIGWEVTKIGASLTQYAIRVPQSAWTYTTYPDLETALVALDTGEINSVFADSNDLEDLMQASTETETNNELPYANLRYLSLGQEQAIFPTIPEFPGRIAIAVPTTDINRYQRVSDFIGQNVGVVEGDFAHERFLAVPRELVLVDLKIFNDLNLPHLQSIASAFLQPARRNGEFLLARILGAAGMFTWGEAVFGFIFGALLGLVLGIVFAHFSLLERALLPYVVASQTIPILAIAPMVVIWLGASATSVAMIAVYITFFPVTINTLRGLLSPQPTAVELMESYAANRWTILWKLRFPSALPYIFAALKVSATASVVGAIIGELPSGISDGLGRAILNFSSDYSAVSTPKLWAAIISAAFVGVIFFVIVSIIEKMVLGRYIRDEELSV